MTEFRLKNGKTLKIRETEPRDAAQLLRYLPVIGGETDNLLFGSEGIQLNLEQEEQKLREMAESPNTTFLLGFIDGEIVSTCSVSGVSRERKCHVGTFGLAVRQSFWHLGIGKLMSDEVLRFARTTGILSVIQLAVRTDNEHAIHLYERLGFQKVGILHRDMRVRGVYADTMMMELMLE